MICVTIAVWTVLAAKDKRHINKMGDEDDDGDASGFIADRDDAGTDEY